VALDEVFIKINGERKYPWRAVDQSGMVLDILVQNRRDTAAARRFFRRLLKNTGAVPRVIITDKLCSYGAAHRDVVPSIEHRQSKYLNNRAENSHQPTRQRERAMKGFHSVGGAQRFLSAFSGISPDSGIASAAYSTWSQPDVPGLIAYRAASSGQPRAGKAAADRWSDRRWEGPRLWSAIREPMTQSAAYGTA
jgi:IS1 family transposase